MSKESMNGLIVFKNKLPENQQNLCSELVNNLIKIEKQLEELKSLPWIEVNPKDKTKQRETPAAKLYCKLLEQYETGLRTLSKITGGSTEEESPLREYLKKIEVR